MQYVQIAMAAVSALSSIFGGIKGSKSAGEAGREQARAEGTVTSAKLEDLFKEEEVLRGQTVAAAAGAGVKTTKGSPLEILAEQAREFARERTTVAKVGATKAAAATTRGRMVGQQAMYQGFSQGAAQIGNIFSIAANS